MPSESPQNSSDFVFQDCDLSPEIAQDHVDDVMSKADDGELFIERSASEALTFDDGRLKNASFDTSRGFGLRCVAGETSGFAQGTELTPAALSRAASAVVMAKDCLLYTSPSPRDATLSRMPSSA